MQTLIAYRHVSALYRAGDRNCRRRNDRLGRITVYGL